MVSRYSGPATRTATAEERRRLDAVGAVASEPEVRQRFGQLGQCGVDKVVVSTPPAISGDARSPNTTARTLVGSARPASTAKPSAGRRAYLRPKAGTHTGYMGRAIGTILGAILAIWLTVTAAGGIAATLKMFS
jgi:hypothetical protein